MPVKIVTMFLFILGLLIFLTDGFGVPVIRGYGGDVVVVMFLYSVLRSYSKFASGTSIILVAIIAVVIEIVQLLIGGAQTSGIGALTLGATFDPLDFVAYALGLMAVWAIDRRSF